MLNFWIFLWWATGLPIIISFYPPVFLSRSSSLSEHLETEFGTNYSFPEVRFYIWGYIEGLFFWITGVGDWIFLVILAKEAYLSLGVIIIPRLEPDPPKESWPANELDDLCSLFRILQSSSEVGLLIGFLSNKRFIRIFRLIEY